MSDPSPLMSPPDSGEPILEQPPRRALAALSAEDQAAWHLRYCPQEGLEMRARATLAKVEQGLGSGEQRNVKPM